MTKILTLSDLHIGGFRSIWPEGGSIEVEPGERQTWQLTRGQEYLWECWQHLLTSIPRSLDGIIINGDVIQGHRDPWSTKLCATSFNDQIQAATELLTPLAKRTKKIFLTAGTKYHNIEYGDAEQLIARNLHAKHLPWLNLKVGNRLINAVHGHATGFIYRTTMLEREAFFSLLANAAHQTPKANIVIRSHVHFYAEYRSGEMVAFFTPCWQLPDDYLATRAASFYKQHPMLGAILLDLNDRVDVQPICYDIPAWNSQVQEL